MAKSSYSERDYAFGQRMYTLRTALGLTQGRLAELLGISRRAVAEWEAGSSYPKTEHLKHFILLGLQQDIFPPDHEAEEVRTLWKAAHQKALFDSQWFSQLLCQQHTPHLERTSEQTEEVSTDKGVLSPPSEADRNQEVIARPSAGPRVDWGNALAIPAFYGREQELAILKEWIVQERCRVVSLLGMGGIGKSCLAVNVMHQAAQHFEVVLFRSLRDAPACDAFLADCLQVLSPHLLSPAPANLEQHISLLLDRLRQVRALVVLDNLESLLEERDIKGRFRPGFEGYGMLLRRIAEVELPGCFLLTSREKPVELRAAEGKSSPIRSLRLCGLDREACEQLFAEKEALGSSQDQARLSEMYAGNPLALKIVAETISDLFGGEISQFLSEGTPIFGSIADLLTEQFARLAPLEQVVLRWLAIAREPVTTEELQTMLATPRQRVEVFEALASLRRRSLIERGRRQASFTLQSVVLEYMTGLLIAEMVDEIQRQQPDHLITYGLEQARTREYVRQAHQRLLLAPILEQLHNTFLESDEVEGHLLSLLHQLHTRPQYSQGYGPTNLLALLRELRGNLRGLDLSHLTLRDAYLQGIEMQDTSLTGARLYNPVFTDVRGATWAVAISCSGQQWAAGSRSGGVRVWSEGGRRLSLAWQAHTDNIYTLAFSPDEHLLATGSWDGTVKLWDLQSGTLRWTNWHGYLIRSVAFAPDGQTLASGGGDAAIRLWDTASGEKRETLWHSEQFFSLTWSPDGRWLAGGTANGNIGLWQVQGELPTTCTKVLTGHTNWVVTLAFSPNSAHLVSGSWDNTVRLWNVVQGHIGQTLAEHPKPVYTVAWSSDGRTVASAGYDRSIRLWDVPQSRYRMALQGHTAMVYNLAFTPDSGHLLSGSEDGTLRLWDVESGQCMRVLQGYSISFYDLAWSPNGKLLARAGSDLLVALWNVAEKTQFRALRGHSWTVLGVAWSPDGHLLASCGWDNAIRLWDTSTGTCLQALHDPDYNDTLFRGIDWSPDGQLLAIGSYDHGVYMWDLATGTRRWIGQIDPPSRVYRVAWSPDGEQLASCGEDGSICLWKASDGMLQGRLWERHEAIVGIAWSPDGANLASCGGGRSGGSIVIWDVPGKSVSQTWRGLPGKVFAVVWSPRRKIIMSGNSEGMICWWDAQSAKCLATCKGHDGAVQALGVSPNGHVLASSGDDSVIRLWDVESAELLQTLRQDRPYERLDITGVRGLTAAQKEVLITLGAVDNTSPDQPEKTISNLTCQNKIRL